MPEQMHRRTYFCEGKVWLKRERTTLEPGGGLFGPAPKISRKKNKNKRRVEIAARELPEKKAEIGKKS